MKGFFKTIGIIFLVLLVISILYGFNSVYENSLAKDYKEKVIEHQKICDNVKVDMHKELKIKNDSLFNANYNYYINDSLNSYEFLNLLKINKNKVNKIKDLKCLYRLNRDILKENYNNHLSLLDNAGVLDTTSLKINIIEEINSCR